MNKTPIILLFVALAGILPTTVFAQKTTLSLKNAIRIPGHILPGIDSPLIGACMDLGKHNALVTTIEVDSSAELKGRETQLVYQAVTVSKILPLFDYSATFYQYWACPKADFEIIRQEVQTVTGAEKFFLWALAWILSLVDLIANFILQLFGSMLLVMIGQDKFITNDIVKTAWPFVQGLANLGFIFALLYIALATTLRLETVSVSVQRLLPKLLLGALLVNFSLVIGGLIIDTSRLLMAVEIQIMGNGTLDYKNFTAKLVESSEILKTQLRTIEYKPGGTGSSNALQLIQNSFFIMIMAAAMGVVAVNLFIRYVALLILLILSPLAYLAIALPQTQGIVKQWWGMFLKWVFYGPIVLFFLIIITRVQNAGIALQNPSGETESWTIFFNQFAHFAMVIALFFVANSVGKKVAGVGSDAVMGFAKKNPRATAIAGASLLSGGLLGGAAAAALSSRSARDFYGNASSDIAKRARATELFGKDTALSKAAKFIAGPERDKDRKLKDGEESWGSKAADFLPTSTSTDGRAATMAVTAANIPKIELWDPNTPGSEATYRAKEAKAVKEIEALQKSKDLSPAKLMKKSTANALSKDQINTIMKHGSDAQREALATHKEVVKKMSDEVKGHITSGLIGTNDLKKKVDSRLRDLANKD